MQTTMIARIINQNGEGALDRFESPRVISRTVAGVCGLGQTITAMERQRECFTVRTDTAVFMFRPGPSTYLIDELDESAQEKALEIVANREAEYLDPDMLEDTDYWTEKYLEPYGAEFQTRTVPLHSGGTREDPAISWDAYPWVAYFTLDIDLEKYILGHKLGNHYRALLNAIRNGDADATVVVGEESGVWSRRVSEPEIGVYVDWVLGESADRHMRREEKLERQASDLAEHIMDWFRDIQGEISTNLRENYEYLTGRENALESARANQWEFTREGGIA